MTTRTPTRRRWLRRIGILCVAALGVVAALALTVVVACQTVGGRRALASIALDRLNEQVPGKLSIAAIDWIGLGGLRGRGLRIVDPDGHEGLRVDRFAVELDLGRALAGELVFASAQVDGGLVVIEELPSGRTRFENALSSPTGPREATPTLRFKRVRFTRMALIVKLDGGPTFRMRGLHGALVLGKVPMGAIRIDFLGVDGILRSPGWNADIGIRDVRGRLDADAHRMLVLRGQAHIASDDPCAWRMAYGPHPRPWVRAAFEPQGIASGLLSAELHVAATFSSLLTME
jgi:hypothetical protein